MMFYGKHFVQGVSKSKPQILWKNLPTNLAIHSFLVSKAQNADVKLVLALATVQRNAGVAGCRAVGKGAGHFTSLLSFRIVKSRQNVAG